MPILFDRKCFGNSPDAAKYLEEMVQASTLYALIATALDGTIQLWNNGASLLYGYEPEEMIGHAHISILGGAFGAAAGGRKSETDTAVRVFSRGLQDGRWEGHQVQVRKDGENINTSVTVTRFESNGLPAGLLLISRPVLDAKGKAPAGVTRDDASARNSSGNSSARNEAEQSRTELLLQARVAELEEANRAHDKFLASMSHALRTPLNPIIGFTSTLLMGLAGPLTPDQEQQLRTVQSSGRQLLSLINDLLDLVRIESGNFELKRVPVNCGEVIEVVANPLRPAAEERGISVSVELPADEVRLATDRRALQQILHHLISNAIKFTEKGYVRIRVSRISASAPENNGSSNDSHGVEFTITDTGLGIRQEDRDKLFTAFSKVHDSGNLRYQGKGLSLHLSQRLAKLLSGNITVESEFGVGSTFRLLLHEG